MIRYTYIIFWKILNGHWFWWHLVSVPLTWIELNMLWCSLCLTNLALIVYASQLWTYVQCLQSTDQLLLEVPRSKRKLRRERAFSIASPKLWNVLPLHIRQTPSLSIFKTNLKTHLFSSAFSPAWDSALVLVFYCFYCFNIVIVFLYCLLFYVLCSIPIYVQHFVPAMAA